MYQDKLMLYKTNMDIGFRKKKSYSYNNKKIFKEFFVFFSSSYNEIELDYSQEICFRLLLNDN